MKIMKSDLAGHGVSQQLRTLVFKKIKFREEELTPSENVDFTARHVADTNNVNLVR